MKQFPHLGPKYIAFIVTLFLLLNCKVHSQIISTIAGNGSGIYNGDSIPATQAQFLPIAITTDRMGNLFISDLDDSRVRRIDVNGIITTIAGNGVRGFSGDGGLAVKASLNYNWGIAFNSSLNLYIVDNGEGRIRKVTTDGIINTIAGIDTINLGGYNGDSILAINARFEHPACVTLDTIGNIYISDQGERIRKINIDGIITTIAGTGVDGYSGDGGLAINAQIGSPISIVSDKRGNIYFTDAENNNIRKVDKDGIISTVAGNGVAGYTGDGGLATLASLNSPFGLAVSNDGTLFIADTYNHAVRKVDTMNIITTIIGDGSPGFSGDGDLAKNAKLNLPAGLAFYGNNLLIADYGNGRIRKVTLSGILAIDLISFNASYNSDGTIIRWQTASGINAAYFNVQRSKDGKSFATIGRLAATDKSSGISNYQFIDEGTKNLEDDILYYRLQSIDKNGSSNYSKTATVTLKNTRPVTLYPNPVNDILIVKAGSDKQEAAIIQVSDLQGKVLKQVNVQLYRGSNSFRIDVKALAKGSYIIEIKTVTTTQNKQFVKP